MPGHLSRRQKLFIAIAVIAAGMLFGVTVASVAIWKNDRDSNHKLAPLRETAETFPVPSTARKVASNLDTTKPLRVIRGWEDSTNIDQACSAWGDAFRTWMNGQAELITGDYSAGQSCTFSAPRGDDKAELIVASYGTGAPQVLMTITR